MTSLFTFDSIFHKIGSLTILIKLMASIKNLISLGLSFTLGSRSLQEMMSRLAVEHLIKDGSFNAPNFVALCLLHNH